MAVAFDAVGPSSSGATASGATTLSWTHTPGSGGVALVADAAIGVSPDTGFSASCALDPSGANTSMPSLGLQHVNNGTSGFQQEFGLANVSSGAHTVQVTVSGGTPTTIVAGSKSYTGADTVSPFSAAQTAFGNSSTPSLGFTGSTSGNMVTGGMAIGTAGTITMSSGTQRWSNPFSGATGAGNSAGGDIAAGGTVTLTWSPGGTDFWAVVAVEVKVPAAAGAGAARPGRTWLRRFHHPQAPLQPPFVAVAAPAAVWLPPLVRIRVPTPQLRVRARTITPPLAQPVPLGFPRPDFRPPQRPRRGLIAAPPWAAAARPPGFTRSSVRPVGRPARGRVFEPQFPPVVVGGTQVLPPQYTRQDWRPRLPVRRGLVWQPPWPQVVITPPAYVPKLCRTMTRPVLPPRRGRITWPPAAQAAPTKFCRTTTRPVLPPRQGRVWRPPWPQIVVVLVYPPEFTRQATRPRLPTRRGLVWQPPWPQIVVQPPAYVPRLCRTSLRPQLPQPRGHRFTPPAPPAPVPRPCVSRRLRPFGVARRGRWAGVVFPGAPPPVFTIGSLTAQDVPRNVLTAAGAASALTASTAPSSTLTAGDKRTGGPT